MLAPLENEKAEQTYNEWQVGVLNKKYVKEISSDPKSTQDVSNCL